MTLSEDMKLFTESEAVSRDQRREGSASVVLGRHQVPNWFPQLPLPLSGQRSAVNRLRLLGKTLGFQTSDYAKCKRSGCRGEWLWGGDVEFIYLFFFYLRKL